MNLSKISISDRFARYFVTLVLGNNVIGLFLTLSKYQEGGPAFWSLLIFVLTVAHVTALVVLLAIDIAEIIAKRFVTLTNKHMVMLIFVVDAIMVGPALWVGYHTARFVAHAFDLDVDANFIEIVRPGMLFAILAAMLAVLFMQWLTGLKTYYAQQASLLAAERRVVQARFDLLAKELHPHLLFNVIQNVLSLMTHDIAARKMLEELAVYYQAVLLVIDKNSITLSKELTLCRHYMALQESRFNDILFSVTNETTESLAQMAVPPLLLQPLLENAVKYAAAQEGSAKEIHLALNADDAFVHITIINPRSPRVDSVITGFSKGLENCEQRMKEFYGKQASINLVHESTSTRVTLDLPYAIQKTN